jgi:hypothetical protein
MYVTPRRSSQTRDRHEHEFRGFYIETRRDRRTARDAPLPDQFPARPARDANRFREPGHLLGEPNVLAEVTNEGLAERSAKARDAFLDVPGI